jgi:hypothetical protein
LHLDSAKKIYIESPAGTGPDLRERANALTAELHMISAEILELDPLEIDLLGEVRRTLRIVISSSVFRTTAKYGDLNLSTQHFV